MMEFPYKYKRFSDPAQAARTCWQNLILFSGYDRLQKVDTSIKIHNLPGVRPQYYEQLGRYKSDLKGQQLVLFSEPSDYERINILSDFFQEPARMQARVCSSELCPAEYWVKHRDQLIQKYDTDVHQLREALYRQCPEAGTFRPTLMNYFIRIFSAKRVLDLCAGWGDRMLGAAAANAEVYHGVDCNPALQTGYHHMRQILGIDPKRFVVLEADALKLDIPTDYDLALTCPPYFTYEIYSSDDRQSIVQFKTEESWYQNFLLPLVLKMWNALKVGGHLVLVLNHTNPKQKYLQWLSRDTAHWHFSGLLVLSDRRLSNPQPIWIWRKN